MEIFNRAKINGIYSVEEKIEKNILLLGSILELLRDIRGKLEELNFRISELQRNFDEKIPERVLGESTFKQEIISGEEMIKKIVSEVKAVTRPLIATKKQLSVVEQKRIEKIISILQQNGKLSSSQLAQLMGLSRTRCNEYLKMMENFGLAEGIEIGKEKYYMLKE